MFITLMVERGAGLSSNHKSECQRKKGTVDGRHTVRFQEPQDTETDFQTVGTVDFEALHGVASESWIPVRQTVLVIACYAKWKSACVNNDLKRI